MSITVADLMDMLSSVNPQSVVLIGDTAICDGADQESVDVGFAQDWAGITRIFSDIPTPGCVPAVRISAGLPIPSEEDVEQAMEVSIQEGYDMHDWPRR